MSPHGSLVGSLLLTMVICLPLTDTWLSSMTLQPCHHASTPFLVAQQLIWSGIADCLFSCSMIWAAHD